MDLSLVTRAQQGDEEAFALLAVAVGNGLLAVAHRILRDVDLAKDATQQAMLHIWRDLPQLRDPARFDAWSYRVLVRECYSEGKRTRAWSFDSSPGGSRRFERERRAERRPRSGPAERAFRRISVEQRAVVVLHYYLDLSIDEIADTLGVPSGTVKSRVHNAMRGLRAAIDADARPTIGEIAQ